MKRAGRFGQPPSEVGTGGRDGPPPPPPISVRKYARSHSARSGTALDQAGHRDLPAHCGPRGHAGHQAPNDIPEGGSSRRGIRGPPGRTSDRSLWIADLGTSVGRIGVEAYGTHAVDSTRWGNTLATSYKDQLTSYLDSPTDAGFRGLLAESDGCELVDDLFAELAKPVSSDLIVKHLAMALAMAGRVAEAEHYIEKFLATTPGDHAALRLHALIACTRGELKKAQQRYLTMQKAALPDSVLRLVEVVFLLHLGRPHTAAECAHQMLSDPPLDPYAKQAAAIAGLRAEDLPLFLTANRLPGEPVALTRNEGLAAQRLVRQGLISVLRQQAGVS